MVERDEPPPGYRTQSPDTSYWAERILIEHWRTMQPWEKAREIAYLCLSAHLLALAGLRLRYPGTSEEELELRAVAQRLGVEETKRLTGFDAEGEWRRGGRR